jgi:hypothetical protein
MKIAKESFKIEANHILHNKKQSPYQSNNEQKWIHMRK